MDSRDSSSLQSNRPPAHDDALLSLNAALAKDAASHFHSRRFVDCLSVLYQLKQLKEDDPKVLHNIAIAEYFQDNCSDPRKLLEALNNVKKKSELLAQACGEQVETNATNKVISGSRESGTAPQLSTASISTLVFLDEFNPAVATLNIAIIWFHLHQYEKAVSVLEPLYHNIDPIDEATALRVCFLLLDVALACHDASKAADVLIYLEKAFGLGCASQGDNGITAHQQPNDLVAKPSTLTSTSSAIDSTSELENSLSRTSSLSEENLEYETVFSLDISGQNFTRPSGISSSTNVSPSMDLKLQLQLYKVHFLLLTRNLKHAKREAKLAMNIARGLDPSAALFLKSQLEYARGNNGKAIKLLMASSNRTETTISTMYNNLGCIFYRLGNHHASSVLFSKALSSCSSLMKKDKPLKLLTFSQDKSLLITYNCGLQYLACGKPLLAALCFQKAIIVFYNRPILWLRLAECCLMALAYKTEITLHVIGQGKWRHLAIENGNARNGYLDSVGKDGQPKLSLSLARNCLLNALYLLDRLGANHLKSSLPLDGNEANGSLSFKGSTSPKIFHNSISNFEDICRSENQTIRQAILADLAYTELKLDNPHKALAAAKSLLELPGCSKIYTFLARVYAAEALCLLNKSMEAVQYLSTYISTGTKIELPFGLEDSKLWRAEKTLECEESDGRSDGVVFLKPEEARGALFANFAAFYAARGEHERAEHFVGQALALAPDSLEATLTGVYVDIRLGKLQAAVMKLKQCSRVKFLPSRVQLNKA